MAMLKACKAFGVNVVGFEHDSLEIILRMEQSRAVQLQQQKSCPATPKKIRKKGEIELKTLTWGLSDSSDRGRSQPKSFEC